MKENEIYRFYNVKIKHEKWGELIFYLFYDIDLYYEKHGKIIPVELWTIRDISGHHEKMLNIGKLELRKK